MTDLNDVLGFVIIAVAILTIVFIIARYSYLIKKELISNGLYQHHQNNKFKYLDIGCIVFGLGIGLLISSVFTLMNLTEDTADLLVWGTILIFGAGGLIAAHFIRKKLEE